MFENFVQHRIVCHWRNTSYRLMLLALALLTVSQTAGCQIWKQAGVGESVMITYRDMVWAKRAYNLRYANCNRPYSKHFENGFRAGYTDVCQGGDGFVPALPPADYRGYEFQSADGARCVSSWFEGYPAGVAAAKKDKSGNYNDILVSRLINSAVTQESATPVLPKADPGVSTRPGGADQRSLPLPAIRSSFTPVSSPLPPASMQDGESVAPPQANMRYGSNFEVEPVNYQAQPGLNDPLPMAMTNSNWEPQPQGN